MNQNERFTLRQLRFNKGETQEETAKSLGMHRSTYAHYENGTRTPRVDVAKDIAKYFGEAVDSIIFLDNNSTNSRKEVEVTKSIGGLK